MDKILWVIKPLNQMLSIKEAAAARVSRKKKAIDTEEEAIGV